MANEFYGLPLKFSDVLKKRELRKVGVFDSICFNIHLILTTRFGENRFDDSYGCAIWEMDFENIYSYNQWKEQLSQSIAETLSIHEKRLLNIRIETQVGEEEFWSGKGDNRTCRVKRKIEVKVIGKFYLTNEDFRFTDVLYISPLSIEEPNN